MELWIYGYYLLMLACFTVSLFYLQYPKVKWLAVLLVVSILTEVVVEMIGKKEMRFFVVYHLFVVLEYALITLILRTGIRRPWLRRLMLISIIPFSIGSLYYSFMGDAWKYNPGVNISIESLLLIIWCILSFFSIPPNGEGTIFRQPDFWFALAFFIYLIGTIVVAGNYNVLLASDSEPAKRIFTIFNSISNYLLYFILIKGIICYRPKKKFL